jgi:type IV pilus biogenesis protein PilP
MLEQLNSEAAILDLQARIAKVRKDIAVLVNSTPGAANGGDSPAAPRPAGVAVNELPVVRMVSGNDHDAMAELEMAGGGLVVVAPGSFIAGVGRVISMSEMGVVVEIGGLRQTLLFASDQGAQPTASPPLPGATRAVTSARAALR